MNEKKDESEKGGVRRLGMTSLPVLFFYLIQKKFKEVRHFVQTPKNISHTL